MTSLVPFNTFVFDMAHGHNAPGAHALKLALTNTQPLVTFSTLAQISEIAPGGGYPAGGLPLVVTSDAQVNGLWSLFVSNLNFVATGGPVAAWRWAVVYDSATGSLIGFSDFGSTVSLVVGAAVAFNFDQVNGLMQGVATSG